MQSVNLADMHAAADRVANAAEATLATEEAVVAAEIAWATANKQAVTGSYWKGAHVARLKAQAARAMADAIAEVMEEEGKNV